MKTCNECKVKKEFSEFGVRNDSVDGFRNECRSCVSTAVLARNRTKKGLVKRIYDSQKSSSKERGHTPPTYTFEELVQFFRNHPLANALYDAWRLSGYRKGLRPSVDRLDDSKGYSMDNIQLMTWAENKAKGHADAKSGKNKSTLKAVIQMTKQGEFVAEYHSQSEAERITGVGQANIASCCLRKKHCNTAGGFKWKFKEIEC